MAQKSIKGCGMGTVNSVCPATVTVLPPAAIRSSTSTTTPAISQSRCAAKNAFALLKWTAAQTSASTTASVVPRPA